MDCTGPTSSVRTLETPTFTPTLWAGFGGPFRTVKDCGFHPLRYKLAVEAGVKMEHLNWGYIQLGLVALAFGGFQVWWIGSTL